MRPSPPGSGTLFITQPQAKKKPSPSAQESGAQQNLLVHTRASPHRQAHASVLTVAATLECCYRLIDGKGKNYGKPSTPFKSALQQFRHMVVSANFV